MIEAVVRSRLDQFQLSGEMKDEGFICLSGRNGAGKTLFLRSVAGQIKPDESSVVAAGVDVTKLPAERRGIVMVTPTSCFPHLRVDAHLAWGAKVKGLVLPRERVSEVRSLLGIDGSGRVGALSLGNRERVALATALLSSPRAILVDEAFSNLHERREFISAYRKLTTASKLDVIFSTQDETEFQLADHGYVIEAGKTERRF